MFRRQILLLGTILHAPRIPSKIELMKWIFLIKHEEPLTKDRSFYDFVPYMYGPFSFTLYRDLDILMHLGYIEENCLVISNSLFSDVKDKYDALPIRIREAARKILGRFAHLPTKELISLVYEKYPWFALRSELNILKNNSIHKGEMAVFTAGYEGESIDYFFQKLIKANIECLIDVRNNPFSRKYGFSKKSLKRLSEKLDISYYHFPELGIPPSLRKSLNTFEEYQRLLRKYERTVLPRVAAPLKHVTRIIQKKPSALFCFEADKRCCHRVRLAQAISKETGMEIIHL